VQCVCDSQHTQIWRFWWDDSVGADKPYPVYVCNPDHGIWRLNMMPSAYIGLYTGAIKLALGGCLQWALLVLWCGGSHCHCIRLSVWCSSLP